MPAFNSLPLCCTLGNTADKNNTISYKIRLGANYQVNKKTDIFVEGNYHDINNLSVSAVNYSNISSLGMRAGIRFNF